MSFLNLLQTKKKYLKPSETYVTCVDGRRFKELNSEIVEIERQSYGFIIDIRPDDVPSKIIDHIYLGSQDCCEETVLNKYNITNVLSIGIEPPVKYQNITYKFVCCLDIPESDLQISLRECIPFIEKTKIKKNNVLVHCNAGVSRSPSIVMGYLILVEKFSYADAYNVVKEARHCIKPNIGFEKQLQCLNNSNFFI